MSGDRFVGDVEADDTGAAHWILTHTGRRFWPMNPRPQDICIEDIVHALSMNCRFTGHVREFYSVAQHCVLASHLVPQEHALAALLHDASEAYLCDVARPVKHHPAMAPYREAERRLEELICEVFHVDIFAPEVRAVDNRLLLTERRDLLPPGHWLIDLRECYPQRIKPIANKGRVRELFMARYEALT